MASTWPNVSVVLPVYNGEKTLAESISSILGQESIDLELVVVDDGSSDDSVKVVRSFSDKRVSLIELQENQGLATALNIGIAAARADLIARQDQDDVSHPERLRRQVKMLDERRDLVLLGTWANIVVPDGRGRWSPVGQHRHPDGDDEIRVRLLWNNPFVHSSVLFPRWAFDVVGGYKTDPDENYPEDYDLWSRLAQVGNLGNVPEYLVTYRTTPEGMSRKNTDQLQRGVIRIARRNMAAAAGTPLEDASVGSAVSALNNASVVGRSSSGTIASIRTFWRASYYARSGGRKLYLLRLKALMKITVRSWMSP